MKPTKWQAAFRSAKDRLWPIRIRQPGWLFWSAVGLLVVGVLANSAEFIHVNRDDINAVSTIVIAIFTTVLGIFTISLARSTHIAAEAAKLNAEALMAAEGAHLCPIIKSHDLNDVFKPTVWYGESLDDNKILVSPTISYVFKNYGKSPAILQQVQHGIKFFAKQTTLRSMHQEDVAIEAIGANEESQPIQCEMLGESINNQKAKAVINYSGTLLFFGMAIFQDFFGRRFQCNWEFECRPTGATLTRTLP
jgi:hypothetical protein